MTKKQTPEALAASYSSSDLFEAYLLTQQQKGRWVIIDGWRDEQGSYDSRVDAERAALRLAQEFQAADVDPVVDNIDIAFVVARVEGTREEGQTMKTYSVTELR